MGKKNIILYLSDQQRWDTINTAVTPNIMKLAKEGVMFKNNFTCQPVCGPARACLQTGLYATQCDCYRNGVSLPNKIKPLAEYFNDAGYQTAYIGKWHLASDIPGNNYKKKAIPKEKQGGYQYWRAADVLDFTNHGYNDHVFDEKGNKLDLKGYRADCINDYALEFLDNRDDDRPFFMFISQLEPHHQNDRKTYEGYKETIENFHNYPLPDDLTFLNGDYKEMYPDYISAINRIDYNVGRLVSKLKDMGIYNDTVIIYSSDHGCHFKTRNVEYKNSCHNSSTHTPLIIKGGSFYSGKTEIKLTSLIDIPPTLLSIAEIPVPHTYMGIDLNKTISSEKKLRDCIFIQISETQCGRAIRTERFKYSVRSISPTGNLYSSSNTYFEDYLYDLKFDPNEKHNLIKDKQYSHVRQELKYLLLRQIEKTEGIRPMILPALKTKKK